MSQSSVLASTLASFSAPHQTLGRRAFLAGAGAFALSACSIIKGPIVPQLYLLRPALATPMGGPVPWRLSVGLPNAALSLDTARIALTRSTTMLDYYANAAWTDSMPLMVQRLLIQAFETSGRIVSVDRDTAGLESDYLLETDIRDFEARYDAPDTAPTIVVSIVAKLVRMPARDIVKSLTATHESRAGANALDSIVLAFNDSCGAALNEITAWTLSAPALR
jgi:cholesterol transport system auxiliary component